MRSLISGRYRRDFGSRRGVFSIGERGRLQPLEEFVFDCEGKEALPAGTTRRRHITYVPERHQGQVARAITSFTTAFSAGTGTGVANEETDGAACHTHGRRRRLPARSAIAPGARRAGRWRNRRKRSWQGAGGASEGPVGDWGGRNSVRQGPETCPTRSEHPSGNTVGRFDRRQRTFHAARRARSLGGDMRRIRVRSTPRCTTSLPRTPDG
jgi:hypothetical protein